MVSNAERACCVLLLVLCGIGNVQSQELSLTIDSPGQMADARPGERTSLQLHRPADQAAALIVETAGTSASFVWGEDQSLVYPLGDYGPQRLLITSSLDGLQLEWDSDPLTAPAHLRLISLDAESARTLGMEQDALSAFRAKDYESSYTQWLAAAESWKALERPEWESIARYLAGYSLRRLNRHLDAIEALSVAATMARAAGQVGLAGQILMSRGLSEWTTSQLDVALKTFEESRLVFESLGNAYKATQVEKNACFVSHTRGAYDGARACYEKVLASSRELGLDSVRGSALTGYADLLSTVGEWQASVEAYSELIDLATAVQPGGRSEASGRYNRGLLLNRQGRYLSALAEFLLALRIAADQGLSSTEFKARSAIGFLYKDLGQLDLAELILRSTYERMETLDLPVNQISTLASLGRVAIARGEPDTATALLRDALSRARTAEVGFLLPQIQLDLADALRLSDPGESRRLLEASLETASASQESRVVVRSSLRLARQDLVIGDTEGAAKRMEGVLAEAETNHLALEQIEAGLLLADIAWDLDDAEQARGWIEQSVDRVVALSATVPVARRSDFLDRQRSVFDRAMRWTWENAGRSESDRIEQLFALDQKRRRAGWTTHLGGRPEGGDPDRQERILNRLSAVAEEALIYGTQTAADATELTGLLSELDADVASSDLRPRVSSLDEIRRSLEPGQSMLLYWLGDPYSLAISIADSGAKAWTFPDRQTVRSAAKEATTWITRRDSTAGKAMREIHQQLAGWLIPADLSWEVVVVADDALNLLAFDALPMNERRGSVMEFATVSHMPYPAPLRSPGQVPADARVAVFADPVNGSDDPRLNAAAVSDPMGSSDRPRLAGAAAEATMLRDRFANASLHTDFHANREAFLAAPLREAQVVHLATHAVSNEDLPALSGFWLSQFGPDGRRRAGFLGIRDILTLDLGAELIVLSACETAAGKTLSGQGATGLAAAFLGAGGEHVVASQWKAPDRATHELMNRFYQELVDGGQSPAEALRAAKRSLRDQSRWRHPYYWAAFKLWRR